MSLNYVTLLITSQDAANDATAGPVSITPTSEVIAAGVTVVSEQAVVRSLAGGTVSVKLVATDNTGTSPASRNWAYQILLPGEATPLEYYVDFANGASQRLDNLTPLNGPAAVLSAVYLPLPGGSPTAGYVPAATGTGEATTWVPNGSGGSGYPASPVVSGTPSTGQVLTATSPTAADWQTPAAAAVSSVFGRTGAVVATSGDYTASQVGAIPSTADLSAIAAVNATAANVAMNSHKLTGLANGTASTDSAAFGQIPTALPPNGSASGDLSGSYPGPVVAKVNGVSVTGTPSAGQYPRASGGSAAAWGPIQAADVPTLNQSTTGNAATATNLAGGATFPAKVAPHVVTLTDVATILVDASLGNELRVTLGGNRTMGAPSNATDGQTVTFEVAQDGSGSRTVTWTGGAGGYSFGAGSAPTLSTAAHAVDLVAFRYSAAAGNSAGAWCYLGSLTGY